MNYASATQRRRLIHFFGNHPHAIDLFFPLVPCPPVPVQICCSPQATILSHLLYNYLSCPSTGRCDQKRKRARKQHPTSLSHSSHSHRAGPSRSFREDGEPVALSCRTNEALLASSTRTKHAIERGAERGQRVPASKLRELRSKLREADSR